MVNSTDNTNNKSQEMEHLASQLSRQLNHSHSQVIQLTSENERLRAQLEALRGGGQQNDSGGASASAVNQQQTGQDLDEACDMTSAHEDCSPCPNQDRTLRPKQKRKYIPESESDDEDPIPIKSEGQKTKTANTNTGYVKKQGAEPSAELQQSRGEHCPEKKARPNTSAKAKAKPEPPKCERAPALLATPPSKKNRPPPAFKPASKSPLPKPNWLTPPPKPSSKFQYPVTKPVSSIPQKEKENQQGHDPKNTTKHTSSAPAPDHKPIYAETPPFTFKLIVAYPTEQEEATNPNAAIDYHDSTDLASNMEKFWSVLKRQVHAWEHAAGAEWAWELQKPQNDSRRNRKRFCVSSKVARQPTRWRKGDDGRYACRKCAMEGKLCFIWVKEDENEDDSEDGDRNDGDDGILSSKGEFWCLPVHPDDRRCEVKKDREIRTWLNEGSEDSGSDSSGEDVESSEEDEWKDVEDEDDDFQVEGGEASGDESVDDDYEYRACEVGDDERDL